ncbi:hypothetical protein OKW96_17880 [Sphingobacterium sp. KU25419]|nr:hypothetical protein OKW96_17880 [Sphingobacterium sp. KU25419]
MGLRGSSEDSGGPAHELAFSPTKLHLRSGTNAAGWQAWREVLVANTYGYFGIGTDNPREKLEILDGSLKIGNTSFGNNYDKSPKNYTTVGSDRHGSLIIGSNVFIESYSNTDFSSLRNSIVHPTMAGAAIVIPGNSQNNQGAIIFHTSAPAVTQADKPFDSPRMIIDAAGNVGIGTISPQELLSVKGNIRAHQIKVETANWPDYVFNDDYNLKSLDFVEKFIQANRHLPDVPKAEIVEKEGYSLNEMDKILLKKIEELTLHLIEKDKEVKNQGIEIAELKQIVGQLQTKLTK